MLHAATFNVRHSLIFVSFPLDSVARSVHSIAMCIDFIFISHHLVIKLFPNQWIGSIWFGLHWILCDLWRVFSFFAYSLPSWWWNWAERAGAWPKVNRKVFSRRTHKRQANHVKYGAHTANQMLFSFFFFVGALWRVHSFKFVRCFIQKWRWLTSKWICLMRHDTTQAPRLHLINFFSIAKMWILHFETAILYWSHDFHWFHFCPLVEVVFFFTWFK